MVFMKRGFSLFTMSAAMLLGVAGCSIASSPDTYFVVDLYGDYEGMEVDEANGNFDVGKATKIGYCYVAKEQKDPQGVDYGRFNVSSIRSYVKADGKSSYDYRVALRTPPHWYEKYVFNSLKGFYNQGNAIDLSKITANCALFTTFDLVKDSFSTTVRDPYGEIAMVDDVSAEGKYVYGTKILDLPEIKNALLSYPASHDPLADPDDPKTWRDPYYSQFTPNGWYLYVYDKDEKVIPGKDDKGDDLIDANKKPFTKIIRADTQEHTLEDLKDLIVSGKMIFEPGFIEDYKEYDVTISYQLRTLNHFDEDGKAHFDYAPFVPGLNTSGQPLPTSLKVRYGKGIFDEDPKPEAGYGRFDLANYRRTLDGKDGGIDRYDISDPLLPEQLQEEEVEGGIVHKIGAMIKRNEISYTCAITLVYEEAFQYEVRFHANPADDADIVAQIVHKGDGAKPLTQLKGEAPAGKTFVTGKWSTEKGSFVEADLSSITADMDLYPILVDTNIEDTTNHFVSEFDNFYGGYVLTQVPALTTTVGVDDFANLGTTAYPFVGIRSFGDAEGDILHVALPSSVSLVEHGVFAKLSAVQDIDLSASKITALAPFSFKNLLDLEYVHLPATLTSLGEDQFKNCRTLLTPPGLGGKRVEIDLTSAQVSALIEEGKFASNWHSDAAVTYKTE